MLPLVVMFATEWPDIREDASMLIPCMSGDTVEQVSPDIFSSLDWEERFRRSFSTGADSVLVVIFEDPGNAASLTVFRKVPGGFVMAGEMTSLFGGNGVEFCVSKPFVNSGGAVIMPVHYACYCRGYYAVSGDDSSYIPPTTEYGVTILATDGYSLWVADMNQ